MAESPAETLIETLAAASLTLAAAESCTAGLVADLIARVPGASRVFWGSFVTYSVDAKIKLLGVDADTIRRYGAVSRETAAAMAEGALEKSGAGAAVSVTGLAGPDGDGSGQRVGTVWIGTARRGFPVEAVVYHYTGDRSAIRNAAAADAIAELLKKLN
ncbi:CinA family protein [Treponema primitia]|uniref:CinA family protein n=1 Tax=Treponema primitia TaxID=88058 RepID=UPI0002555281|nr:nicotinamide-nucleotide amidohydrolase family protein [Treponema primitia]